MRYSAVLFALGLFACNTTNFRGSDKSHSIRPATVKKGSGKKLALVCKNGKSEKLEETISGSIGTTVEVEGEFCGEVKAGGKSLTIALVIDGSGSMDRNDKFQANTCGRWKAGKALIEKLSELSTTENISIKTGMVTFGTVARSTVALTNIADFSAQMTAAEFCIQTLGTTNYEDAFIKTKDLLKSTEGAKIIYFISDGLPSVSNAWPPRTGGGAPGAIQPADMRIPFDAGAKAAKDLRETVPDLTINAVFLGVGGEDQQVATSLGIDLQKYLADLVGAPERVKVVNDAGGLASEIAKFKVPEAKDLGTSDVAAVLAAPGFPDKPVSILEVVKASEDGVWRFKTAPFELYGKSKDTVVNSLTVKAEAVTGTPLEAQAVINFKQD